MTHFRKSPRYRELLTRAASMEDHLSPHEAIEWIDSAYGPYVSIISVPTLHSMVFSLCLKNGYVASEEEVNDAITDLIDA